MKKLLICGDSFAADWQVKYPQGQGWCNLITQYYHVTNVAQAGCSEYRIYQQLIHQDLNKFDCLVISHTSPNRIFTPKHPVHFNDPLHKNADLIYTDLKHHADSNPKLNSLLDFFENYYDLDYACFIHNLILKEIDRYLEKYINLKILHTNNLYFDNCYQFPNHVYLNFEKLFESNRGIYNHFDDKANRLVCEKIVQTLDTI